MFWLTQIGRRHAPQPEDDPERLGSSAVAIVGIAGVVIVFVAVLSMAQGFFDAMHSAGAPDRALVMRSGADDEMTSGLSGPETDIIKQAPGLRRDGQRAIASAELFVHHRSAQAVDAHAGQRADARHRADDVRRPRRGEDRRGPDVAVRHQRGRSSAARPRGSSRA